MWLVIAATITSHPPIEPSLVLCLNNDNRIKLGSVGGCEDITAAVATYPSHSGVADRGSGVFAISIVITIINRIKLGSIGGCKAVVTAMATHPSHAEVARQGCVAVGSLNFYDDNSC